jgi:GrpB-like predicted nucleotidyltransferase (UPF0157 family)
VKIEIVPYNSNWPGEFERIAADLSKALGALASRIDHIGSTSVPGLAAKDIIDIQISVSRFDPELEKRLTSNGYLLWKDITNNHKPPLYSGTEDEWEKRLYQAPANRRRANIHVRIQGRANQRYALLFRDYLRSHPTVAQAYADVKRRLAYYVGEDREAYTEIKDPVCDVIMAAAEEWAEKTGWKPAA